MRFLVDLFIRFSIPPLVVFVCSCSNDALPTLLLVLLHLYLSIFSFLQFLWRGRLTHSFFLSVFFLSSLPYTITLCVPVSCIVHRHRCSYWLILSPTFSRSSSASLVSISISIFIPSRSRSLISSHLSPTMRILS